MFFDGRDFNSISISIPLPDFADAIIQVEDTKLLIKNENGIEMEIELKSLPSKNTDVRYEIIVYQIRIYINNIYNFRNIGSDLTKEAFLFSKSGMMGIPETTILASVGIANPENKVSFSLGRGGRWFHLIHYFVELRNRSIQPNVYDVL